MFFVSTPIFYVSRCFLGEVKLLCNSDSTFWDAAKWRPGLAQCLVKVLISGNLFYFPVTYPYLKYQNTVRFTSLKVRSPIFLSPNYIYTPPGLFFNSLGTYIGIARSIMPSSDRFCRHTNIWVLYMLIFYDTK